MAKKITIHTSEIMKARYGAALEELKLLLGEVYTKVKAVLEDEEAEAPYVSAGQMVGFFWQHVINNVATRRWDLEFAMKSIEALNSLLDEDLQNNNDFTAGFTSIVQSFTEEQNSALGEMGFVPKEAEVN